MDQCSLDAVQSITRQIEGATGEVKHAQLFTVQHLQGSAAPGNIATTREDAIGAVVAAGDAGKHVVNGLGHE
jgi:hypothetical protein